MNARYEVKITKDKWTVTTVLFGRWFVTLEKDGWPVTGSFARSERAAQRKAKRALPHYLARKERERQERDERAARPCYRIEP